LDTTDLLGGRIHGAAATALRRASEDRGDLVELLTSRDGAIDPIVHVYQVLTAPGSIRAWVFHEHQDDRLCFTAGRFKIVLYDLRPDSPTVGALVTILAGAEAPLLIRIPALVAHGVQNLGDSQASFVNLPTNVYYHDAPDKHRLPPSSPLIPHTW
jgi:dTDP-4-dehydrorhamnose 3,5-epimerase